MFGISSFEFLMILLIGVIVLGPEKLPRVMRTFNKVMSEFRRVRTDLHRAVNLEIANQEHQERKQQAEAELLQEPKTAAGQSADTADNDVKEPVAPASAENSGVAYPTTANAGHEQAPTQDTPAAVNTESSSNKAEEKATV